MQHRTVSFARDRGAAELVIGPDAHAMISRSLKCVGPIAHPSLMETLAATVGVLSVASPNEQESHLTGSVLMAVGTAEESWSFSCTRPERGDEGTGRRSGCWPGSLLQES